jgi:hypothetical protein
MLKCNGTLKNREQRKVDKSKLQNDWNEGKIKLIKPANVREYSCSSIIVRFTHTVDKMTQLECTQRNNRGRIKVIGFLPKNVYKVALNKIQIFTLKNSFTPLLHFSQTKEISFGGPSTFLF